jgi:hypothetical protein
MYEDIAFQHNGRALKVRAAQDGDHWLVGVFEGGKRATPVTYTVTNEIWEDGKAEGSLGDLVKHLMELARDDVTTDKVPLLPTR